MDIVGKLFKKILPTRDFREVNECGLLSEEQFGFRPGHRTTLQQAGLLKGSTETLTR
jgi:hypothetical protein